MDGLAKLKRYVLYKLTPGTACLYNEGDLHSPRREFETRLIRIEGTDLTKVRRDKLKSQPNADSRN